MRRRYGFKLIELLVDGTSNTALMSESIIGNNSNIPPLPNAPNPQEVEVQIPSGINVFADIFTYIPMSAAECANSSCYRWDRQTNWIEGDYRDTLYDHYYAPNSPTDDCLRGPLHRWREARSRHPGGVNILLTDGSVRFIKNSINIATWRSTGNVRRRRDYQLGCLLKGVDTDAKDVDSLGGTGQHSREPRGSSPRAVVPPETRRGVGGRESHLRRHARFERSRARGRDCAMRRSGPTAGRWKSSGCRTDWRSSCRSGGSAVRSAFADRGVVTYMGQSFIIYLAAYAQSRAIEPDQAANLGLGDDQVRLLLFSRDNGPPVVRAIWKGKPAADAAVKIFHGPGDPTEVRTDAHGEIPCPDLREGPWSLLVQVVEKTPGKRDGRDYSEIRYKATLAISPEAAFGPAVAACLARVKEVHGAAGPWAVAGYRIGERALKDLGLPRHSHDLEVVHHCPAASPVFLHRRWIVGRDRAQAQASSTCASRKYP